MSYLVGGLGAVDSTVQAVQAALRDRGAMNASGSHAGKPLDVDGIMGPNTAAAIVAFWGTKGVSRAGVVDSDLLSALGLTGGASPPGGSDVAQAAMAGGSSALVIAGLALGLMWWMVRK